MTHDEALCVKYYLRAVGYSLTIGVRNGYAMRSDRTAKNERAAIAAGRSAAT
jgi:hypothetical protein